MEKCYHHLHRELLYSYIAPYLPIKISISLPQPPVLCPLQEASYILSFDDGGLEKWFQSPVKIEDNGEPVEVILDSDKEPRLKRERNYTLKVTVVTEYVNISSTTHFSRREQALLAKLLNILFYRYRVSKKFSRLF